MGATADKRHERPLRLTAVIASRAIETKPVLGLGREKAEENGPLSCARTDVARACAARSR
jgi:hypothetical protein